MGSVHVDDVVYLMPLWRNERLSTQVEVLGLQRT